MNKSQGQSFEEEVLFIACKKNIIGIYILWSVIVRYILFSMSWGNTIF